MLEREPVASPLGTLVHCEQTVRLSWKPTEQVASPCPMYIPARSTGTLVHYDQTVRERVVGRSLPDVHAG